MKNYFKLLLVLVTNTLLFQLIVWSLRQPDDLFVSVGLIAALMVVPINYKLIKLLFTKNKKQ